MRPGVVLLAVAVSTAMPSAVRAEPMTCFTTLAGVNENPPNASPGTGSATVVLDTTAQTLRVIAEFSDLLAVTTVAHVHCCVAPPDTIGVATMTPSFAGFPAGVTAGSYDSTFDTSQASTFNASFVTANGGTAAGAEAALAAGLAAGQAYFNIHSTIFGAGEIRGFLTCFLFADGFESGDTTRWSVTFEP